MSDQLAVSAALSILMMAIFVLFGTEAADAPSVRDNLFTPAHAAADIIEPSRLLPLIR